MIERNVCLGGHAVLIRGETAPVEEIFSFMFDDIPEEDIEQAIGIILETARNERIMRPQFGGGLNSFLFESNSSVTHQRIRESVRNALIDWEPRIDVENVSIAASPTEPNLMFITIDYAVRRSNTFYNRVYPFYLNEAG